MSELCDVETLGELMRSGDPAALDRFSRCYGERLVAIARQSCRIADDAEDAVQDALVEAGRSMTAYRGEGSPLAWLSTLVVRRCHRLGRGLRHEAHHDTDVEIACSCHSPEGQAQHAELARRISQALVDLDPTDRAAVILAHEGHTGPEIGAHLDLTPNAVRSRLKRARHQLRVDLSDLKESP